MPAKKATTKKKTAKTAARKKPATKRSPPRTPPPPASPAAPTLNDRQRAVRRALIEGLGRINATALAREFKCSRVTIWRDRDVIRRVDPIKPPKFNEAEAIAEAIEFYETAIDFGLDELEDMGDAIKMVRNGNLQGAPTRVGLINAISRLRSDYSEFLFETGLIKRAAMKLGLEDETIAAMKTQDQIKAALVEIRRRKAELKRKRASGRSSDD